MSTAKTEAAKLTLFCFGISNDALAAERLPEALQLLKMGANKTDRGDLIVNEFTVKGIEAQVKSGTLDHVAHIAHSQMHGADASGNFSGMDGEVDAPLLRDFAPQMSMVLFGGLRCKERASKQGGSHESGTSQFFSDSGSRL